MAFLPMFPLNLVVFPNESLNLHIFEPRYRELVDDCLLFGIPTLTDNQLSDIGTEVEVVQIAKKYPSGESDIKTKGKRRFIIDNFYRKAPNKSYGGADIRYLEDIQDGNYLDAEQVISLIEELFVMMGIEKSFEQSPQAFQAFDMAHHVGFNREQEMEILKLNQESDRLGFMKQHLEQLIPTLNEMKKLQERIKMNGHFKDVRDFM